MTTPQERERLRNCIKEHFSQTLRLAENPQYKSPEGEVRLAMALLPVQTVGNARFRRFEFTDDGRIRREVYAKNRDKGFSPENVDQPLRYVMSFLLAQYAKAKERSFFRKLFGQMWSKLLDFVFSSGDLKEVAEYIRKDIKMEQDEETGIAIFCGRDLMGLPSVGPVKG